MSIHAVIDTAINIGCVVVGFYTGLWLRIGKWQPSTQFYVALGLFTIFGLWCVTGVLLHVDFCLNPFSRSLPYYKCYRFGVFAGAAFLYGLYLLVAGKARATD
jgi:hypothetical protein